MSFKNIRDYSLCGGTLIALAANEIVMDRNASMLQVLKIKKPQAALMAGRSGM